VLHFVKQVHVIKDNLFPIPPLFRTIQEQSGTTWKEMYKVFNMGHRMELYVNQQLAQTIIDISHSFGIDAQIIGRVEASETTQLTIQSEYGEFLYS
jgi:phosphoribosylformylglycinamidine cyclo-ligase